jgi:hypothetical protein
MSERETPTGDPEQDADPRVLALLQRGTPANGIDLAPWWRANVASLAAPLKPRRHPAQTWMPYAAVFVVGIAMGFVGGRGRASSPVPNLQSCRYTESERAALDVMFAESAKMNGEDWSPRKTAMLTLCSTCHVARPEPKPPAPSL